MRRRRLAVALSVLAVVSLAWGVLAFGAVYSWAYTPMAVSCAATGAAALIVERRRRPRLHVLGLALGAIAAATALQLVPLPMDALARVSPNVDPFLRQYSFSYLLASASNGSLPNGSAALWHPASIAPERTMIGLGLLCALSIFLVGMTRLLSGIGAKAVARAVIALGVVVAFVGLAQQALISPTSPHPLIYGFWKPVAPQFTPFGPFVNPNHFAGWMLMALALAMGVFCDSLVAVLRRAREMQRNVAALSRVPEIGALLTSGLSLLVMGLSLMMTRSRSGLAAFAVATILAMIVLVRRQAGAATRSAVVGVLLVLVVTATAWAGFGTAFAKFGEGRANLVSVSGRINAWADTLGIIGRFPVTGTGLDTYGVAMEVYQSHDRDLHFQEAHNDYLQLAAEGGLLVGVPIVVALVVIVRTVRRRFHEAPKEGSTYWLRVGAVIGLVSIAVQALVEFSLQMPGNAALFTVIAAIALHRSPHLRHHPSRRSSR